MKNNWLREIAKFLSGMVAAKIITVLWLSWTGLLPLVFAGTPFADYDIVPAMIFNVGLLAILVYYGWHVKSPVHSPSEYRLLVIAGAVFLVVALVHALRLMFGSPIIFGDYSIPVWLSWFGFAIALYLSYSSFHFALRMKRSRAR